MPRRVLSPQSSVLGPLALLGGTFDPPHIGHLVLAECARVQFGAAKVLFLPAGDPYRKRGLRSQVSGLRPQVSGARGRGDSALSTQDSALGGGVTAAADRLAMVRLAVAGNPAFVVDDREVRRPGPTYTVDTLEELHAEGQTDLVLILGSDAVEDLPNWKQPGRIAELATIVVARKGGGRREEGGAGAAAQSSVLGPQSSVVDMPPLAISSTEIRARVAAGKPIRYLVPEAVEAHIRERRLYQPRPQAAGHRRQS